MAVIRRRMPAFALFQPVSVDDVLVPRFGFACQAEGTQQSPAEDGVERFPCGAGSTYARR